MTREIQIRSGIPPHDAAEFAGLPDELKWEVLDLLSIFREAAASPRPRVALEAAAAAHQHLRGWSMKSLERKFYALVATRDWRSLVNRAKTTGDGKSEWITPAVGEAWKGYCDRHMRSFKSAYIEMAADYRIGKMVGDVDWRRVWQALPDLCHQPMPTRCPPGMPLPPGWSYHNLMRHKPREIETEAARRGRHAALKLSSRVHTTRDQLAPGMQYEFDDMWHNCMVMRQGYPKAVRPLELACIDIASAHKVAFALKPRMEDADGKRKNITEADMRFLVAHVLCNVGYHRDGCTLLVEGGTATVRDRLQKVLAELSGGKIAVSVSGVDRKVPLGKWGYDTKGNPDHKAHVESWHNLAQNRLDAIPGYTGSNARLDKPEDHNALMRVVDKMLAASCVLPAPLAEKLRFPVLDWATFSDVVHEVYAQIGSSNDHALEGWSGRTERQWRAHPADLWHSEADFVRLPQQAQDALAPIIAQEGMTRVAKLSRRQVWEGGRVDLVRLPDWAVTLICGEDLAELRPCPSAEVVFVNKEIDDRPMIYRLSTCVDAAGRTVALKDGESYLWMINPFDPRAVFVCDVWGGYVGKCLRIDQIDRANLKEIGEEIGRTRRELDTALAPLARRSAVAARQMIGDMAANAALLRHGNADAVGMIERDRAVSGERKAAIRGVTLDDLCGPVAGAGEGNEGAGLDALL
jgi:hypothetical protein